MLWWLSVAPLGKPVVPLVYWMLIGSSNWVAAWRSAQLLGAARARRAAMNCSQSRPMNTTCSSPIEVVAHVVDHLHVVGGLERRRRDQHPAAGLAQDVLELGRPVGRVDVDQDDPGLGRRVLDERPLGAVRAPDPDAVAGLDPGGDERARRAIDGLAELRVRVAQVLVDGDQRLAVREPRDRAVEVVPDRVAQQRRGRRPGCVRRLHASLLLSRRTGDLPAALEAGAVERDRVQRRERVPSSRKRTRLRPLGSPAVSPGA